MEFFDGIKGKLSLLILRGVTTTINSQTILVKERDNSGNVTKCSGAVVPTDGGAGYAIGCEFTLTTGNGIGTTKYFNEGSASSCDFNVMTTAEVGDISAVTADSGLVGGGATGAITISRGLAVRNESGSTITKGSLVRVSGYSTGQSLPLVVLADANASAGFAMYVASADITNNTNGTVYGVQVVTNINTDGAAAVGDPLYLSETAGAFTQTAPSNSNSFVQKVATVLVKHATTGSALFYPELGIVEKGGSNELQSQSVNGDKLDSGMFITYGGLLKDGSNLRQGISVYNNTGGTLNPGTLVNLSAFTGTDGVVVTKADADAGIRATHVVITAINNLASGNVIPLGTVQNLNTNGRTIGDLVYVDATTAGAFTFTAPTGADQMVQIVGVVKVVNATTGEIVFFPGSGHITKIPRSMLQDDAVDSSKISEDVLQIATFSLTEANILAMNGAPVEVVPAPGAGKAIQFDSAVIVYDFDTAAYTGGGDITLAYTGGAAVSAAVAAADSLGAAGDKITAVPPIATDHDMLSNTGLSITNATAAFTDPGTAAGVARLKVAYRVITTNL